MTSSALCRRYNEMLNASTNNGAEMNAQDNNGKTPLHKGAEKGDSLKVDSLLRMGALVNAETKSGFTPLHLSAYKGHIDVCVTLINHRADVNARENGKDGRRPLHMCAWRNHVEIVNILVTHGADVDTEDTNGRTALHSSAKNNHVEVAETLINHGADVNKMGKDGRTPLHMCASEGHREMTEFLLEHQSLVNAKDEKGQTPLHKCISEGHEEVAQLLVRNGALIHVKDNKGRTPLDGMSQDYAERLQDMSGQRADLMTLSNHRHTDLETVSSHPSRSVTETTTCSHYNDTARVGQLEGKTSTSFTTNYGGYSADNAATNPTRHIIQCLASASSTELVTQSAEAPPHPNCCRDEGFTSTGLFSASKHSDSSLPPRASSSLSSFPLHLQSNSSQRRPKALPKPTLSSNPSLQPSSQPLPPSVTDHVNEITERFERVVRSCLSEHGASQKRSTSQVDLDQQNGNVNFFISMPMTFEDNSRNTHHHNKQVSCKKLRVKKAELLNVDSNVKVHQHVHVDEDDDRDSDEDEHRHETQPKSASNSSSSSSSSSSSDSEHSGEENTEIIME